jgi:pyruvate kinase
VTAVDHGVVHTRVVTGGPLSSRKGINAPGVELNVDVITEYDREVLAWGLDAGIDLVAQSFVRSARDVERLSALIGEGVLPSSPRSRRTPRHGISTPSWPRPTR